MRPDAQPSGGARDRTPAICDSYQMLLALLRQYIRPYRRLVAVLMVLQLISTLASLYLPTVNAAIIDDGVAKGDTADIVRLGMVMLAVTGLQVLCSVGAIYFGSRTGMGFGRDLRRGDVRTRHHLLRARDRPIRRADVADPQHQRRPADPVPGSDDRHRTGHRADHVRRRNLHGHPPGGRVDVAAAGQRPDPGAWPITGSCRTCCRCSAACRA